MWSAGERPTFALHLLIDVMSHIFCKIHVAVERSLLAGRRRIASKIRVAGAGRQTPTLSGPPLSPEAARRTERCGTAHGTGNISSKEPRKLFR